MEASALIKKVHMNCPLCDKAHEVEERKRVTTITLKGEEVSYEECFYFCANSYEDENEFETGSMTNENLLNARNAYRVQKGLLTSDEIVALEFLKKNSDKFNAIKRNEIRSKIVEKLDSYGKEFLTRQAFEGEYANFEEPCDSNGYTTLNIDKLEAAISYIEKLNVV